MRKRKILVYGLGTVLVISTLFFNACGNSERANAENNNTTESVIESVEETVLASEPVTETVTETETVKPTETETESEPVTETKSEKLSREEVVDRANLLVKEYLKSWNSSFLEGCFTEFYDTHYDELIQVKEIDYSDDPIILKGKEKLDGWNMIINKSKYEWLIENDEDNSVKPQFDEYIQKFNELYTLSDNFINHVTEAEDTSSLVTVLIEDMDAINEVLDEFPEDGDFIK